MSAELITLWEKAASIDRTLRVHERDLPLLKRKRVKPTPYSRPLMFAQMSRGQVCLFENLRVPVRGGDGGDLREVLAEGIRSGFPKSRTARIQKGRSRQRCRMRIPEVIRRWEGGRSILSVTDLHFRETKFDDLIDTTALSDFNVLCNDPESGGVFRQTIEMMTLVISSEGNLTDIHADDCDGTNHCFLGRKLWLAWDRLEGRAAGFQDVDRDPVCEQATFDLETFLTLPSSGWFTVGPGQTLFLPGNLAHKVITLEHYLGVGSFHVALPSYLRSLERWIIYDTLDIVPKELLAKVNRAVLRRIGEVRRGAKAAKEHWGLAQMKEAVANWHAGNSPVKGSLIRHPLFAEFFEAARRA
ncbi:MAG: hypothetical protein JOZ96_27930 [Acidobacteria bacterium]|nr:hypothetical protein [Acidobacteriota bacterium]